MNPMNGGNHHVVKSGTTKNNIRNREYCRGILLCMGVGRDTVLYRREQRVRVPVRGFRQFLEEIKKEEIIQGMEEVRAGYALFLVCDEEKPAYILNIENMGGEKAELVGRLGAKQMEGLIRAYKEKIDKNRFLQNLLLDNMLLVDVYNQAKKLHIENDQKRIVFLVEAKSKDNQMLLETMKGMYASGMKDFVTAVDESSVILVKALEETDGYREVYESAKEYCGHRIRGGHG